EFRRVQKRPLEMRDGADVARDMPTDTAVDGIAHDRVADRAEVNPNLMGATRVNGHSGQRQRRVERLGADDSGERFTASTAARRRFLAVRFVASEGRVDAPSRMHHSPDQGHILLLHFTFTELARELFVRAIVLGDHHQAGRSAIEPVNDTWTSLAADAAEVLD